MNNLDIRKQHAIMDCENEIKWQKEILKTATDKDTIFSAQERIT